MAPTWTRSEPRRPAAEASAASRSGDDPLEGLLALVAGGDEQAFAELYGRVAPAVFGLVARVVRDPAQAEEVTQEVVEQVETGLERERVRRGLAALTDLQREAVVLAYYGGYTHREIAELLGVPSGTVKTRLRDGLLRLRDHLGVGV